MNKKPVLSDQDKRKVLSAKKKQKVVLKNVLVQPFERYWPELSAADVHQFVQRFQGLHKSSDDPKATTSIKASTNTSSQQNVTTNKDSLSDKVILGLRSSIRCVSSGRTVALFISSKIRPKYIVDQIIIMAVTKNPNSSILCVPDMDAALQNVLGFSCQCLAVVDDQNEIWNWSVEKFKQFAVPKSLRKFELPVTERMNIDGEPQRKRPVVRDEVDVSALYLHKANVNGRTFIPSGTMSTKDAGNDFISLGSIGLNIANIRPKHQMISKDQKADKTGAKTIFKPNVLSEKFPTKHKLKTARKQRLHHNHNKFNYLPLKVNKIQANADKVRNKNKKKNKKNKN
ncbi:uncharacterized protein LOC119071772 isoform X2 [Bradysia coprophila]|uniref:uncharacterized protein LOC119071772 isoform X2 n=1 Tax=Bradysia coprophila TaxID=38358 RepID=UPI00187DCE2A|nr:uncharacterized protein LOC119071772 isoform X2 [Bradysia coprophila]